MTPGRCLIFYLFIFTGGGVAGARGCPGECTNPLACIIKEGVALTGVGCPGLFQTCCMQEGVRRREREERNFFRWPESPLRRRIKWPLRGPSGVRRVPPSAPDLEALNRSPRQISFPLTGREARLFRRPSTTNLMRPHYNFNTAYTRNTVPESHRQAPETRRPVVYPLNVQSTQNFPTPESTFSLPEEVYRSHQLRPTTRRPVFEPIDRPLGAPLDISLDSGPVLGGRLVGARELGKPIRLSSNPELEDSLITRTRTGRGEPSLDIQNNFIQNHPGSECGISQSAQARILGGLDAGYGQFPWAAIITVTGENIDKMCAGTLLNSRFIITAGHCTSYCKDEDSIPECKRPVREDELTFKITLGEYDYDNRNKDQVVRTYHSVGLFLHPQYTSNARVRDNGFVESDPHFDVAILKLDRHVKLSNFIAPICLPEIGEPMVPDQGTVIGWGRVGRHVGDPHSSVLQAATVPLLTPAECEDMDGGSYPTDDQLCAGVSHADHSACPGDSGGGLMTRDDRGRWYLIGIVSTGPAECGLTPVIYHNVSATLPWIRHITSDLGAR